MDLFIISLRMIHILAGIFWVGSALIFRPFFFPVLRRAGSAGDKIMHGFAQTRLSITIDTSAVVTTLTGLVLYWHVSGGLNTNWITSDAGLTLTAGSLAGLVALLLGAVIGGPMLRKRLRLATKVETSPGPATAEQRAEIDEIHDRLGAYQPYQIALMVMAIITMVATRYLGT
ncbi:MAG: hypothetical protein ACE5NC_11305 [Anaerolineae bacterium]